MPLLHVGPNLIQDEGDDVRLHSQEQNVTVPYGVLIASGQIHAHPLQEKRTQSIVLGNADEPRPPTGQPTLGQLQPKLFILSLQGSMMTPK